MVTSSGHPGEGRIKKKQKQKNLPVCEEAELEQNTLPAVNTALLLVQTNTPEQHSAQIETTEAPVQLLFCSYFIFSL